VERIAEEESQHHFDLSSGPLLRMKVLRLSAEEHVLLFTIHHIISDGWSVAVMIQELSTLYNSISSGTQAELPTLSIQYKDYTSWQQAQLEGTELSEHRQYWHEVFEGEVPLLDLPTDRARPKERSYRGGKHHQLLGVEQLESLKKLCHEEGCSLFMGLLALVHTQLYRYTGQSDQVLISQRPAPFPPRSFLFFPSPSS